MIVEYIRYRIPEASAGEFLAAYGRASASLDRSQHCLGYELSRGVEERGSWILRIEWDSVEGHENGFRRSVEFGEFLEAIRSYVPAIAEMKHYQPSAVASA
ncbi:MAG TPA: antibiotic biosynthesis monooxygenase family protein [Candidatus Dormibacteraeota bacterium]|jgi:quinol monooxygenase YgiN|nr:antibiotic biosynthesis monooxygenase family protein [Candidatus Dormibacteraeota bacterium]